MGGFDTLYYSTGLSTWYLISAGLALLGAVAAGVYFLRPQGRTRYTGLMEKLSAHVNFERLIFPELLKFAYVASALYAVFSGIVTLASGSIVTGILMIVLGPIAVRVAYELTMAVFSVLDGIKETNRLLRAGAASRSGGPQPQVRPMHPAQDGAGGPPKQYPGGYDPLHKS
ncbi:MAG: hypothetical protein IH607_03410 [Firmicutes bacterium]|nr:hypothetical protein [Bacillota bacterium]